MESINDFYNISETLKGHYIEECARLFIKNELINIPSDVNEQETDGITFLVFSNQVTYAFYPYTEKFTLTVKQLSIDEIPQESKYVTSNIFWQQFIGKKISHLNLLFGKLSLPYGVRFAFEDNTHLELRYESETTYTFDALVIRSSNIG